MTRLAVLLSLVVLGLAFTSAPANAANGLRTHASATVEQSSDVLGQRPSPGAELIAVTGPNVMEVPGPGHETQAEFVVTNLSNETLPLSIRFSSAKSPLFGVGEHLSMTVTDGDDRILSSTLRAFNGGTSAAVTLAPLPPGESRVLQGALALKQSAGNEYQGLSGNLRISFDATTGPPQIAKTGASYSAAAVAAVLVLTAGGAFLLTRRTSESTRQ